MATHQENIARLREQGVEIPAPEQVYIAPEVDLGRISGPKTVLFPGTRLTGAKLRIMDGCKIGQEGPATVDNCALGRGVALKAGYFAGAVFLDGANIGLGAHVRKGTVLEEEANGAHTVGLKQTILLPFVTLGSLINFCDIFMAGGTSRRDHSEVGSSFIHFNFTPHGAHGDKATASLIGDVPRGVMLREKRIFLGGQAGLVGPVQMEYGTVLAAGYVYRQDHGPDQLVVGEKLTPVTLPFNPKQLNRILDKVSRNLRYLGNIVALRHWYTQVRAVLAGGDAALADVYQAGVACLDVVIAERRKQLGRIASYMDDSIAELEPKGERKAKEVAAQRAFADAWPKMDQALQAVDGFASGEEPELKTLLEALPAVADKPYTEAIQALPEPAAAAGTRWLEGIVTRVVEPQLALMDLDD
jgi:bifunctional UDP-N-acetylglucosamine pyrophosphorylase/glucosamine-1-phosphate N-acetyltransferase